jgi:hypothetical protein
MADALGFLIKQRDDALALFNFDLDVNTRLMLQERIADFQAADRRDPRAWHQRSAGDGLR